MTRLDTFTEQDNSDMRRDRPGDIAGDWVYAPDAHELIDSLEAQVAELKSALGISLEAMREMRRCAKAEAVAENQENWDAANYKVRHALNLQAPDFDPGPLQSPRIGAGACVGRVPDRVRPGSQP